MADLPASLKRALRFPEVQRRTGLGKTTIKNKLTPGHPQHDESFPRPFPLGDAPNSPKAWDEDEIDAWIRRRIAMRDRRLKPEPAEAPA